MDLSSGGIFPVLDLGNSFNDKQKSINSASGLLRDDKEFTDVTLASEDGHQIDDHKVYLLQVCRGNSILKASLKIANTCLQSLRSLPTTRRTMHRKPPFCTCFGPDMPKFWFSFIQSKT